MTLLIVLLLLQAHFIEGVVKTRKCTHDVLQDDQIFSEHLIADREYVRSVSECSVLCGHATHCKAFAYTKTERRCRLHSAAVQHDGVVATGWRFYAYGYANCLNDPDFFYDVITGTCYFLVRVPYTFDEARHNCELMNGRLSVFDTIQKINSFNTTYSDPADLVLIGLSRVSPQHNFTWVTGTELGDTNWDNSCPRSTEGLNCVVLKEHNEHIWHSVSCDTQYHSLCELF